MASARRGANLAQSRTRQGTAYGRVPPRVIVCDSSFSLFQCLQAAVDAEDDAPPDIEHLHSSKRMYPSENDAQATQQLRPSAKFDFTCPLLSPNAFSHPVPKLSPLLYHYSIHAERDKARKRAKRAQKRANEFSTNTRTPRPEVVQQHVASTSTIPASISLEQLPANASGYDALSKDSGVRKPLTLEGLVNEGYDIREWDGRESILLVDSTTQKIFGVCVGMPDAADFQQDCKKAADFMQEVASGEIFKKSELEHKRGGFPVFNAGILSGHGPPQPYNLRNAGHEDAVEKLLSNDAIRRLALHQDAAFKLYAPNLYDFYHRHTIPLRERMPHLRVNWDCSIFSAAAFNLGPDVVTYFHRDCMNLAFGWCAIHALGQYDPKKGGHLVLKEAKLAIEFPPGALILLPSATIAHGNTGIQAGETRLSFTQYSSGAMFRFVDNGFRTVEQLKKADKAGYSKMLDARAERWKRGLGLWSTAEDILTRAGLREDGEVLA